jgi:hypothetical protein
VSDLWKVKRSYASSVYFGLGEGRRGWNVRLTIRLSRALDFWLVFDRRSILDGFLIFLPVFGSDGVDVVSADEG